MKKIFLLLIVLYSSITIFAQQNPATITLSNSDAGQKVYNAQTEINFLPGYVFTDVNGGMNAFIENHTYYSTSFNNSTFNQIQVDQGLKVGRIDGSYSVTPSGGANYSIPIKVPVGTAGMQPNLSINYNSQAGNGILGYGWDIAGLSSISLVSNNWYFDGKAENIKVDGTDKFAWDGSRLFVNTGTYGANNATYGTEVESYNKITSYGSGVTPDWFKVETKEGVTMEFGSSPDSKLIGSNGRVVSWKISKIYDPSGNYMNFQYLNGNGEIRIERISYGGNSFAGTSHYNRVEFNYSTRGDNNEQYFANTKVTTNHLVTSIRLYAENSNFKVYDFEYFTDNFSFLKTIKEGGSNLEKINSTSFKYGDKGIEFTTDYCSNFDGMSADVLPAKDFNGDGKSDILLNKFYHNEGGNKIYHQWEAMISTSENNFTHYASGGIPVGYSVYNYTSTEGLYSGSSATLDFRGDGRTDVLLTNINGNNQFYGIKIINISGLDQYTTYDPNTYPIGHSVDPGKCFYVSDFDGDGKDDVIYFTKNNSNNIFSGWMMTSEYGEVPLYLTGLQYLNSAEKIRYSDIDGDGKTELMVTYPWNSTEFFEFTLGTGTNYAHYENKIYYSNFPLPGSKVYIGDFNGDQKTDLLTSLDGVNNWTIGYSTGNGFNQKSFSFNNNPYFHSSSNTIQVLDIDSDGLSDIVHAYNNWNGSTSSSSSITTYYSNGLKFSSSTNPTDLITSHNDFVQGDFNGDGILELLNRDYYQDEAKIYKFRNYDQSKSLVKIKDGFLNEVTFNYTTLSRGENYTNGTTSIIPIYDAAKPLKVIKSVFEPDGLRGFNQIDYSYSGAKWHGRGKGFLGFTTVNVKDITNNTLKITQNNIKYNTNISFSLVYLEPYKEIIKKISDNSIISEKTFVYESLVVVAGQSRMKLNLKTITDVNNLTTITKTINNTYNTNGNISSTIETNGVETITNSYAYSTFGTWWIPSRVASNTTTISRTGETPYSRSISYSYNDKGKVQSQITDPTLAKAVTTSFEYDNFGNAKKTTTSATGLPTKNIEITYDILGRFALTTKNELGQTTTREVERLWGNPTKITDPSGLITTYSYDNFGALLTSTNSRGVTSTITNGWDITSGGTDLKTPNNTVFYVMKSTPNEPYERMTYDCLGREVKKEIQSLTTPNFVVVKFDKKGNQITKTDPFTIVGTPIVYTNTYDEYGRITQTTNGTATSTYSYSANAGNSFIDVQTPNGSTNKKIDASGKVVQSTDEGGTLNFTYYSNGELKSTANNGQILVQNEYDQYGRQTKLIDIDAGTTLYDYNAYGQLISQTDANNVNYQMQYDVAGRMTSKTGPEGTTTSTYVTSGNGLNQISQISGPNGVNISYSYDNFGRIVSESKLVDGVTFTTGLAYDVNDNVTRMTYPSGFQVNNTYSIGVLTKVIGPNSAPVIYQLPTYNEKGQLTTYKLGNSLVSSILYDNFGMPTKFITSGVQNYEVSFNSVSGKLEYRKDYLKNRYENFSYDNVSRLNQSKVGLIGSNLSPLPIDITYSANGNIQNKSDVGNYVYDNAKIHAVVQVDNANQTIPSLMQNIVYTPFDRVQSISEGAKSLNFTYDPELNRIKTVLTDAGTVTQTKYFIGNYEKIITPTGTKEIHYIPTGNGTDAVYVLENGVGSYYFLYKDHLGSIVSVTNISGTVVYEQNFDAWGKRRNATDWLSTPVLNSNFSWLRGFTGHEHLDDFGLINMNNRLYDPVIGRMCSVDNFVQNPYFTQNYNRYSYVYNNPLSYTDPSGEWVQMVVGAAIGMVQGGIIAHQKGYTTKDWQFYGYILGGGAIGAVSGGVGEAIVSGGGFMCQTVGIMASSYINSVGMAALNGGGNVGISFGAASFDLTNNEWNYLGKKGNSTMANFGYLFGGLANLQDIVTAFYGVGETISVNAAIVSKEDWWSHSSSTKEDGSSVISIGPDVPVGKVRSYNPKTIFEATVKGAKIDWPTHLDDPGTWTIKLNNVSTKAMENYRTSINQWDILFNSCIGHQTRALWRAGVPTIYLFHPYMLNLQLSIRQLGIYSSPYLNKF